MPPGSRAGWGLFALTMGGTPFAFPGFTPASTPPSPTIPTGYYDIVRQGDTRRRHTPNGPHKKIADTLLFTVRCNVISSAYSGPCSRHRPRNPAFVNGSDPHDFSLKEDPAKLLTGQTGNSADIRQGTQVPIHTPPRCTRETSLGYTTDDILGTKTQQPRPVRTHFSHLVTVAQRLRIELLLDTCCGVIEVSAFVILLSETKITRPLSLARS